MSEIVHDASGAAFELAAPRAEDGVLHLPLRLMLERRQSVGGVLDAPRNHEAMVAALVEVGELDPATAQRLSFEDVRQRVAQALSDHVLRLAPYVSPLRPMCEVVKILESEALASEPVTELHAAQAAPAPEPWPGDAAAQAQVLLDASELGTPFCEVCEKARLAASA